MESLDSYQKYEHGDPLEGTSFIGETGLLQFIIDDIPIAYADSSNFKSRNDKDNGLAYCTTWKEYRDEKIPHTFSFSDKLFTKERTHAVIIYNFQNFVHRFESALLSLGYNCLHDKIEYVNTDDLKGEYGWRKKPNSFSHEEEYRFFFRNIKNIDELNIEIGSIEDISCMVAIDKIQTIKLDY